LYFFSFRGILALFLYLLFDDNNNLPSFYLSVWLLPFPHREGGGWKGERTADPIRDCNAVILYMMLAELRQLVFYINCAIEESPAIVSLGTSGDENTEIFVCW
jgi:hypothetical protein